MDNTAFGWKWGIKVICAGLDATIIGYIDGSMDEWTGPALRGFSEKGFTMLTYVSWDQSYFLTGQWGAIESLNLALLLFELSAFDLIEVLRKFRWVHHLHLSPPDWCSPQLTRIAKLLASRFVFPQRKLQPPVAVVTRHWTLRSWSTPNHFHFQLDFLTPLLFHFPTHRFARGFLAFVLHF